MNNRRVVRLDKKYVMHTYSRIPIAMERGEGVRIWDSDGKEYLDFISGIGVNAVGHCHPEIIKAVESQLKRLLHCSNLYHIGLQAKLAEALCEVSFADKVFFLILGLRLMRLPLNWLEGLVGGWAEEDMR